MTTRALRRNPSVNIAVAGIVAGNNIVLVDTYNILRRRGVDTTEAAPRSGAQLIRPLAGSFP